MAGGRGTRISELFPDIPKPLIPIDHVPVLAREIRSLASQGFNDIIITVYYEPYGRKVAYQRGYKTAVLQKQG